MIVKSLGDKQTGNSPNFCLSLFCSVCTEHLGLFPKGISLQDCKITEKKDVGLTVVALVKIKICINSLRIVNLYNV